MELKEGMYVRTKAGMISKIVSKEDVSGSLHREEIVFILDNGNRLALHSQKVVKASNNIIDLIEKGDLVTLTSKWCENEVYRVMKKYDGCIVLDCFQDGYMTVDKAKDIKSILTKEQFESMSYKV